MIRFITYIAITIISIGISCAQITTEEVSLNNEGIDLPGTLTFTQEKSPLIIWIHGSGGVLRDGGAPQYIKQFRNEINKNNIAFFSYDKRTANAKNAPILQQGVLFDDFVSDAKVVINHFKKDTRFSKIILAGHSQGSLIAMLASENTDKYISLAGAGETIDKTLTRQITNQSAEFGEIAKNHIKELLETGEIKNVNPNLMSLFAPANQAFFRNWMQYQPTEEIKKLTIPSLIINGNKDLQVLENDANNLKKAKPEATLVIIENMNHLLKDIQQDTDNLKSYSSPDFPISKKLIETVVSFVKK